MKLDTLTGQYRRIQTGICSECHKPIYDDDKKILSFHLKCLEKVKETKKSVVYRIPSTGGIIRIGK